MSLTAAEVAEIMRLVEQSSFDECHLEIGDTRVSFKRGASVSTADRVMPISSNTTPTVTTKPKEIAALDANTHEVSSPLLGTFYRSPKPGAAPYVEVGSQVEEDSIVAIIEVMKLMNTVRAGVKGTVTEIAVADGALAEYGQALMRVRKSA